MLSEKEALWKLHLRAWDWTEPPFPLTTVVAELKLAAPEAFHTIILWNEHVEKLSTFINRCRAAISTNINEKISQMKIDGELLPIANTF